MNHAALCKCIINARLQFATRSTQERLRKIFITDIKFDACGTCMLYMEVAKAYILAVGLPENWHKFNLQSVESSHDDEKRTYTLRF